MLVNTSGFRLGVHPNFPPLHRIAFDSLYWMRHPHPLISIQLLSLMLLCRMRATSHEQPLDTISL